MAKIEADIAAAQGRAIKAREFRDRVDRLTGAAEVDGVRARVDITGRLLKIQLPRQLENRDPDRLGESVMAAIREAHAKAAGWAKEAAAEAFGEGSQTANAFSNELDTRFATATGGEPR